MDERGIRSAHRHSQDEDARDELREKKERKERKHHRDEDEDDMDGAFGAALVWRFRASVLGCNSLLAKVSLSLDLLRF